MTGSEVIPDVERRYQELVRDAERGGYHLNPDLSMTKGLIEGLLVNKGRYGYEACPCRLSFGTIDDDRDIICPCDYRDSDLSEFGACYCGLYLTGEMIAAGTGAPAIPERQPESAHRALDDARTCADCYFELVKRGVIMQTEDITGIFFSGSSRPR